MQPVEAPEQAAPVESPAVLPPPPVTPETQEETTGGDQATAGDEEFLKLQPDILAVTNPPAATAEQEIKKSEPGEPKAPQDKPVSEGQTDQQDEQKKE